MMLSKYLSSFVRTFAGPCILIFYSSTTLAHKCEQTDPSLWKKSAEYDRVINELGGLFQCIDTTDKTEYTLRDKTACNWFVGKSMEVIYGDNSFKLPDGYMTANQIAKKLHANEISGWKKLGSANEQSSLTKASDLAEKGKPVIAAWKNSSGNGHVNIVIPGGTAKSSSWGGLDVPNSANLSLNAINRAYIGCRLSYGFGSSKRNAVYLYTRS